MLDIRLLIILINIIEKLRDMDNKASKMLTDSSTLLTVTNHQCYY